MSYGNKLHNLETQPNTWQKKKNKTYIIITTWRVHER